MNIAEFLTREADEIEWYLAHVNTPGQRIVDEQYLIDRARAERFHENKPDGKYGGKMGGYTEFIFLLAWLRDRAARNTDGPRKLTDRERREYPLSAALEDGIAKRDSP